MSTKFNGRSAVILAAGACFVLYAGMATAQGNSGARGGGPKVTTPVQTGKPATPPGQAKQPPATSHGQNNGPKSVTPLVVKPALSAKLQPLLPPGVTVAAASAGFKNLGQFVAATHVAKNLDLSFTALKAEMVTNNQSLGDAIHTLKPDVNAKVEASRAEGQAKVDINSSSK